MSEKMNEKMHNGSLYNPGDPEVMAKQEACMELQYDYNQTRPGEGEKRQQLLEKMFAKLGKGVYIEPPLHANWGGHHDFIGDGVYANFNLTLVDDTYIHIGAHTMIGPNVTLATAGHPIIAELRAKGLQYNAPVTIGENCWLGAGVIVIPGVTVGDNTVIGAGSVVTRDLPSNVVAVGDPCKVLRPVGERDREYYFKDKKIDWNEFKD